MNTERQTHNIPPLYNGESKILILGSFPSVKSRESGFFYGHPQNRFWRVISAVLGEKPPLTIDEKKSVALRNYIAVWDVLASCSIRGSSDSSIAYAEPNNIGLLLSQTQIKQIFINGKTARRLYEKYIEPEIKIKAVCLPSTSPANAAWSIERLIDAWSRIKDFL